MRLAKILLLFEIILEKVARSQIFHYNIRSEY